MSLKAVIFDLDDILLDTSALLEARDRRAWAEVFSRLDTVQAFQLPPDQPAVTSLPGAVRDLGLAAGLYTQPREVRHRAAGDSVT